MSTTTLDKVNNVLSRGYLGKNSSGIVKDYIFINQDVRCCFCNRLLTRAEATIEHIEPKSTADDAICNSLDNLTISCKTCNEERATADFHLFRSYTQKKIDEAPKGCLKRSKKTRIAFLLSAPDQNQIVEMFLARASVKNIKEKYNVSTTTIKRLLKNDKLTWFQIRARMN